LKIPTFKRFAQKGLNVDHRKRLLCPQCPNDVVMVRHFPSVRRQATVDECPSCGSYWLDAGELAAVRAGSETEEARDRAAAQ
jgi:Zn-finger nucleic acid-binding protein